MGLRSESQAGIKALSKLRVTQSSRAARKMPGAKSISPVTSVLIPAIGKVGLSNNENIYSRETTRAIHDSTMPMRPPKSVISRFSQTTWLSSFVFDAPKDFRMAISEIHTSIRPAISPHKLRAGTNSSTNTISRYLRMTLLHEKSVSTFP